MPFDYEQLRELYEDDPLEFEEYTRGVIDDWIKQHPEDKQQRLRSIQWRIDQELNKYKDPITRMNRMVELLWKGVSKFDEILNQPPPIPSETPTNTSEIIDFPGNK